MDQDRCATNLRKWPINGAMGQLLQSFDPTLPKPRVLINRTRY
jgi:hypothetical protein